MKLIHTSWSSDAFSKVKQRECTCMRQLSIVNTFLSLIMSLRPASPAYALPLCWQRAVDRWPYALGGVSLSSASKFRTSCSHSHDQGILYCKYARYIGEQHLHPAVRKDRFLNNPFAPFLELLEDVWRHVGLQLQDPIPAQANQIEK